VSRLSSLMRGVWLTLILVASCTPEAERDEAVASTPQALTLPAADLTGMVVGDRLGASLAACRSDAYLAGAPGKAAFVLSEGAGVTRYLTSAYTTALSLGTSVACEGDLRQARLVGGTTGLWLVTGDAGLSLQSGSAVLSMGASPLETPSVPLLVNDAVKTLLVAREADGGVSMQNYVAGGAASAWSPDGTFFAVGHPANGTVTLFQYDGGAITAPPLDISVPVGFGSTLAIGEVHPSPGFEIVVGGVAQTQVLVYSRQRLLMAVDDLNAAAVETLGAALAIEPGDAGGGLHALWVGAPASDRIFRFIGDAGTTFQATAVGSVMLGAEFGAAIAFNLQRQVLIGAPRAGNPANTGAVFRGTVDTFFTPQLLDGVAQECQVGAPCSLGPCLRGACYGGVLCLRPAVMLSCAVGQSCNPASDRCVNDTVDAGTADAGESEPDAGARDAGAGDAGAGDAGASDAGASDAGVRDAGVSDAGSLEPDRGTGDAGVTPGQLRFVSCGCQGGAGAPLGLLALALARRRR